MAGSHNFLVFNPSDALTTDTDATYQAQPQRVNGLSNGMAITTMHNKLYRQMSVMVTAIANFMANQGQVITDADVNALTTAITNSFQRKDVYDAHAALTTTAHGARSAPIPNTLAARDLGGNLSAYQFISSVPDAGVQPFTVISKTKVTNLNAEMLNGFNSGYVSINRGKIVDPFNWDATTQPGTYQQTNYDQQVSGDSGAPANYGLLIVERGGELGSELAIQTFKTATGAITRSRAEYPNGDGLWTDWIPVYGTVTRL